MRAVKDGLPAPMLKNDEQGWNYLLNGEDA